MRKNLLATVTSPETPAAEVSARSDYARRGASRSMMMSIDEMAENAKKVIAGETIVSLDPHLVDPSFVRDRVDEEEADFAVFRQGISESGQLQPILVRPHPDRPGRFMIVFGHRRARAARELGLPVRAVVKEIEEINHIIAQGQENSRRADLTFIERSLLARKLMEMSQSKDTIKAALTIDDTTLSRMLSVVETIPSALIEAIGSARGVGRDRWEALKKIVAHRERPSWRCKQRPAKSFAVSRVPRVSISCLRVRARPCGSLRSPCRPQRRSAMKRESPSPSFEPRSTRSN